MEANCYGRHVHRYSLHLSIWNGFTAALLLISLAATLQAAELTVVENGKAETAIVVGSDAGPLVKKAADLLQSRIEQRTGARLAVVSGTDSNRLNSGTHRIILATPGSSLLPAFVAGHRATPSAAELGEEGFYIATSGNEIVLVAREGRGMIYAVGKLLHTAKYFGASMYADPPEGIEKPFMADRFLHITPHCHTFFQMEDAATIGPIIEEMALWGLNGLSIEIEESDFNDPFDNSVANPDGRQIWALAKGLYQIGNGLGLKLGLVDSANDPYKNQMSPEIATKGQNYNQQPLANPTIPAARALLLRNKENMYRDLKQSGLRLDNALWFAYDTGGCFDETCRPWITTFMKLSEDLAAGLQQNFPGARAYVTDWLADDEEGERITDYLNGHPQTKIAGVWKQDRTAMERYARLDKRFPLFVFLDVTMVGAWGTIGAQPFPSMVNYFVGDGARNGITGLMIYTEGIYDDFNKALAAQVAWNPSTDAGEFAHEYASYFFGTPVANDFWRIVQRCERSWEGPLTGAAYAIPESGWLQAFTEDSEDAGKLEAMTLSAAARLRPEVRSSWRWQVFEYRARIGKIAAGLRWEDEYRRFFLNALQAGVPKDVLKGYLNELQNDLDRYDALVTELRQRIYHEPVERVPSMDAEKGYMIRTIRVDTPAWRKILKELNTKVDAAP